MTTDAVDTQEQQQEALDATEAQADADFEAAFNTARGDEPHAEGTTSTTNSDGQAVDAAQSQDGKTAPTDDDATAAAATATGDAAAQAQADAAAQAAKATTLIAGLTEDQLKALLAKAGEVDALKEQLDKTHNKAFGHIGEMQKVLNDLKKASSSGQGGKLTTEKLKRLSAEFPEMAAMLVEDLNEAMGSQGNPAPALDQDQIQQLVSDGISKATQVYEKKLLGIRHPDFVEAFNATDFKLWKTTLRPEAVEVLNTSWDSAVLGDALDAFKSWRKAGEEAALKKAATDTTTKQRNDKRLEAATTPQGVPATGAPALDDDAAFELGFKKARGGG